VNGPEENLFVVPGQTAVGWWCNYGHAAQARHGVDVRRERGYNARHGRQDVGTGWWLYGLPRKDEKYIWCPQILRVI